MKNKFTITISDVNGSKHYLMNQIMKKIILYFVLIIVLLMVGGSFFISFLMREVTVLHQKKLNIEKEYKISKQKIQSEYFKLEANNTKLKKQIEQKILKYSEIEDKINNIEELIGLKPDLQMKINDRLNKISFTSKQMQIIFQNIPNGYVVPFKGITSPFGWRINSILKRREFHKGLDFRAERGTPIKAPADGVIEFAGFDKRSGYGNLIIIDHNFGFKTIYGHLKKVAVKAGEVVEKGEVIGYTGSSGLSTGPHLHYEIRFVSRALNPIYFVNWDTANFKKIFKKEKRVPWESLINMINNRFQPQKQQLLHQAQK